MRLVDFIALVFVTTQSYGQSWVHDLMNGYKDSIDGYGIVALVNDAKTINVATIGVSHNKQPIVPQSRFCIGSCTKMYTATLVLKLHEKGLLKIQDSVYHYLPRNKFIDSTITIRHLLNHTSGITDFTKDGFINATMVQPHADYSDSYILSQLDTIEFSKGTKYQYSNTNYFLLRMIIESATDRPYEWALQEYILNPLGLRNTFPYYSNQIEKLAHPIINGQDLHEIPKRGCNAISRGVGNIVSDPHDVNKFIRALLVDRTLLSEASLELMTSFYKDKVGLGLFCENYAGETVWGHAGRQISYISYAFVNVATKESIVLLNNNANDEVIDRIMVELCKGLKENR